MLKVLILRVLCQSHSDIRRLFRNQKKIFSISCSQTRKKSIHFKQLSIALRKRKNRVSTIVRMLFTRFFIIAIWRRNKLKKITWMSSFAFERRCVWNRVFVRLTIFVILIHFRNQTKKSTITVFDTSSF